jgi:hypothetical protein
MNLQDLLSRLWQGLPLQPAPPNPYAGDREALRGDPLLQKMMQANSQVPWLNPSIIAGDIPSGTGNLWGLPWNGKPANIPPPGAGSKQAPFSDMADLSPFETPTKAV